MPSWKPAVNELDPRIVRIGIEINGKLKTYDNLTISASGTKFANTLQNEADIRVANLSKPDREYLLTETSPFNQNRTPKRIMLYAGRRSTGLSLVFVGDISSCLPSQPPDITLIFKASTGQFQKGNIIARSQAEKVPLLTIAQQIADDLGLALRFEAIDKHIANYAFTGSALKQIERLGEVGGVNAFVDDQTLVVKNSHTPLRSEARLISESTGMIGIPELTEYGVKVKYLLDKTTRLGGALTVDSTLNPAALGHYVIFKLHFEIANRDTPFYWIAEAKRIGPN
ncbi:hypothetical protein [Mycoavidus sp. SF9855]|uniref:baseplate hub protein n=1 Tax=Mycoavidus sp. SF9855 TaxID=2968475 RepID=UPI00211C5A2F|nr:hypothetical protein [Mycoavidus sp. SF9855]UUM20924.1 hypothetical protein NQD60_05430 [Mycoavidus sp. SF9855]